MDAKLLADAIAQLDALYRKVHAKLRELVFDGTRVSSQALNKYQLRAHGLAYLATEVEAARQLSLWQARVDDDGFAQALASNYIRHLLRRLSSGVDLGPCETMGLDELGLNEDEIEEYCDRSRKLASQLGKAPKSDLVASAKTQGHYGDWAMDDELLTAIRSEFRRFVDKEVVPIAQDIHRADKLIPLELIGKMSDLGVFGLTIPDHYGGQGLSKVAMCVVTEELSRGYIGVGSLGTRAEIAAELILGGGNDKQKEFWLPKLANGSVLPTAVFTEPNYGSDLAHIKTRAERQEDGSWKIYGQKTWITHASRADLMTLLARTDPSEQGYSGLSMFLAPKSRGSEDKPESEGFPDAGLSGTEISVLGYRGMKEFEISFDDFNVEKGSLLGEAPGKGFKQLMATFESARIQTAARGVGVAQAALEEAMRYGQERIQFGVPLVSFPRVTRKLETMMAKIMAARQLTFFAAKEKDAGQRCDLEAGMAKLLATRAAWEAADACVQIHGGNGYAEEYVASRLLVDARVLSIFEGANEIQAHVIARRLLEQPTEGSPS